jgi:hypothetical protein
MANITDPFSSRPPTFPAGGSPLAETARQHGGVVLQSVEEQTRAMGIPVAIADGETAPTFQPMSRPAPSPETTPVPTPPKP